MTRRTASLSDRKSQTASSGRRRLGGARQQGLVRAAYYLAAMLGGLALVAALPAIGHLNLATAPGWARAVLSVAFLQAVYAAWMAAAPDESTLGVAMIVSTAVAALHAAGVALAIATPAAQPLPLGLDPVRYKVAYWCGAVVLAMSLAAYLCGRARTAWRRQN
ncbi:MAG: hypothetical protein JW809_15370 [Pirellulales bacterium]|nr:hypothetical protein [Pirellulales bacterium]